MAGKGTLSNRLLGRLIYPNPVLLAMASDGSDTFKRLWPFQPNGSGSYYASIEAVWTEEGKLKVLARGPQKDIAHIWLHEGLIELGDET